MPTSWLEGLADELLRMRIISHELVRQRQARKQPDPSQTIRSFDDLVLQKSVLEKQPVWQLLDIPTCHIPGMLTDAEKQYYLYISKFYSGNGEVVELGPWLGQSSFYLLRGLRENPGFAQRKLQVFDDFVWRSAWMNRWLSGTEISSPENHASFEQLFVTQMAEDMQFIEHARRKIADYDGNEALERIHWPGERKISLIVVDCGRMLSVNQAWWDVFSPSFIAGETLIVMQDWQHFKTVPELYWENTKIFTDALADQLELVHEVAHAGIGTFLYLGKPA